MSRTRSPFVAQCAIEVLAAPSHRRFSQELLTRHRTYRFRATRLPLLTTTTGCRDLGARERLAPSRTWVHVIPHRPHSSRLTRPCRNPLRRPPRRSLLRCRRSLLRDLLLCHRQCRRLRSPVQTLLCRQQQLQTGLRLPQRQLRNHRRASRERWARCRFILHQQYEPKTAVLRQTPGTLSLMDAPHLRVTAAAATTCHWSSGIAHNAEAAESCGPVRIGLRATTRANARVPFKTRSRRKAQYLLVSSASQNATRELHSNGLAITATITTASRDSMHELHDRPARFAVRLGQMTRSAAFGLPARSATRPTSTSITGLRSVYLRSAQTTALARVRVPSRRRRCAGRRVRSTCGPRRLNGCPNGYVHDAGEQLPPRHRPPRTSATATVAGTTCGLSPNAPRTSRSPDTAVYSAKPPRVLGTRMTSRTSLRPISPA